LKGAVELSPRGEIVINDRNETNVKGVFAAGDCTTVPYKQIIIATGEGRKHLCQLLIILFGIVKRSFKSWKAKQFRLFCFLI
jgi:alkyl hydroperoxide reductase subunit AhpF